MAGAEAGAARERADRRVAGVLGSARDRAGRARPGARSKALADAFEVPGPGSPRMFQDVIDEYVEARWQDRLGLTRGFEHVRDVAGEGEWGEQVACVRHLYRETDRAITGDKAFEADVREEVEALCRKAGATEFDMALVRIDRIPAVVDVLHRHPDGSAYALPRFPPLPPGRGSFEAETWDSHLAELSAQWAQSRGGEAGPPGGAEVDRAVRDGYLALRGAAFFTGGSHYSAERDQPPPRGAARPVEPGADRAEGSSVSAGVEAGPGASAARAADRSAGRASGDDGEARGGDALSRDESSRRGGDDDDSLAKRLAGSGDHADQAVCKYIVDCFDGAVQKVVASFDRKLSGLAGGKDPAAAARPSLTELPVTTSRVRKKLIEVALPLDEINAAGAREKSVRHGHPSTLHLWWSRKPLAVARAVIFAQVVDDPSEYVDSLLSDPATKRAAQRALRQRRMGDDEAPGAGRRDERAALREIAAERERERLFGIVKELVRWENTTNETVLEQARIEIAGGGRVLRTPINRSSSTARHCPPSTTHSPVRRQIRRRHPQRRPLPRCRFLAHRHGRSM